MNNLDIVLSSTNLCVVFLWLYKRDQRYANVSTCLYPFVAHILATPKIKLDKAQKCGLHETVYVDYDRQRVTDTSDGVFNGIEGVYMGHERMYEQSINLRDAVRTNGNKMKYKTIYSLTHNACVM